jgi:hypothetical protein
LPAGNALLKEYMDGQKVQVMTYAKQPALAIIPKDEEVQGKYYPVPTQYEVNQGRSATFANAQGNQTAPAYAEFLVTYKTDYDVATIANQALEASYGDKGAFMRLGVSMVESATRGLTMSLGSSLFRSGTGSIGQISGSVSSGVITLVNPADVSQFGYGQTLQANSSDGGTPRAALGYVIGRSVRNGTVTVSATAQGGAAGTPTGWSGNDYLLVQGDNNSKLSGFSAWLPLTDPTSSDSFYGVNRSADYRLFGVSYDGSGQPIEEALIDHSMLLEREGASVDYFLTNFGSHASIVKALGTRREYEALEGPAGIGFRAVMVDGAGGPLKVLPDRNCQVQAGWMLQLDTWKFVSIGPAPKILRYEDRLEMLRVYNADSAECRVGAYPNLVCFAPGWNGQTKLSS